MDYYRLLFENVFEKFALKIIMYHFRELNPIFSRLADISLLASCGRGLTQNSNESLHRLVWSFVPKEQFNSPNEVQLGIDLGVLIYNVGREDALRRLMHAANLPPSSEVSIKALQDLDQWDEMQRKWRKSGRRNGKDVSLGYLPSRPSRASTTAVASFTALPVWRELLHGAGPAVS